MPAVNQLNGFGGTPGFNNWPNMTQPYTVVPQKPLYDPSKPSGDCLKQVNGSQSAAQADLVTANGQISNANQTQTLLNTMGKWIANPAATTA